MHGQGDQSLVSYGCAFGMSQLDYISIKGNDGHGNIAGEHDIRTDGVQEGG